MQDIYSDTNAFLSVIDMLMLLMLLLNLSLSLFLQGIFPASYVCLRKAVVTNRG